ncbi:MAG: zinc-dependent metalloprotease [Bacteroidota bacterium]|nr:zinc-dependent metalloprotease [Bacteroidota bacterium]
MKDLTRILSLALLLSTLQFNISAQSISNPTPVEEKECGSDKHHTWLMKTDAAYKYRHIKYKATLDSLKYAPSSLHRQQPPVYTIPVVVHVIHLGEAIGTRSNIPDIQILDALAGINDRFANMNGMGRDIEINFCLANRDPNGCPTSGINRVDGSAVPRYADEGITWAGDCGAEEQAVKDLIKWPTWEYYNIWVVHDICGDIAGYAYYPNGSEYDGTVIDIVSMTYDSRTLAHELGHGLNVQHTFSGEDDTTCPTNDNCMEDGDEICDTPPHRRNDCGFNNPCSSEGNWDDSRLNWMSYCGTSVTEGRFTEDQRTRMRDALIVEPRLSLLSSFGCANEVSMRFTSEDELMCAGEERLLTATPEGGNFHIYSGPGIIEGDTLTTTGAGIVIVEYIISQENCSSSVYQEISVKPTPNSRLRPAEDSLCIGQSTTLQGIPAGGVFTLVSGPGILDSNILTATGEGEIELLYEIILLGCLSKDEHVVISNAVPEAGIEMLSDDALIAVPDTGVFQWVRCDLDYALIQDATGSIFVASTSGNYAVIFIDGMCRDTSDCISLELTAIENNVVDINILLYPNPVTDKLYVGNSGSHDNLSITMFDLRGVPVKIPSYNQSEKFVIDMSGFAPGVYVLKVDVEGSRKVYRVVKI